MPDSMLDQGLVIFVNATEGYLAEQAHKGSQQLTKALGQRFEML
jgi:hypothetical protein